MAETQCLPQSAVCRSAVTAGQERSDHRATALDLPPTATFVNCSQRSSHSRDALSEHSEARRFWQGTVRSRRSGRRLEADVDRVLQYPRELQIAEHKGQSGFVENSVYTSCSLRLRTSARTSRRLGPMAKGSTLRTWNGGSGMRCLNSIRQRPASLRLEP